MTRYSDWLYPDWPAPSNVGALMTSRYGGVSGAPYDSMNLGLHVPDDPEDVNSNRDILAQSIGVSSPQIHWLNQVHGTEVVKGDTLSYPVDADGAFTSTPNHVCVVMTADCLPVLMCDLSGTRVAAIHAGWRGLSEGIIENALARFDDPAQVIVWLGAAIGPGQFEVGADVRASFQTNMPYLDAVQLESVFVALGNNKYLANLYELATMQFKHAGVTQIYGGQHCTFSEPEKFYSYRRDGQDSGRMATCIWLR